MKKTFLQYLWGIETNLRRKKTFDKWKFLQYLWGIETFSNASANSRQCNRFYSTYEELKLGIDYTQYLDTITFLQYLWGIETL